MKVTRENLTATLAQVTKKIGELESKKRFRYTTENKFLDGIGCIAEFETLTEAIKAQTFLKNFETNHTESAAELKVELKPEDLKLQGFTIAEWKEDLAMKVQELKDGIELSNLIKARKKLKKNLSENDIFAIEMGEVESLLGESVE